MCVSDWKQRINTFYNQNANPKLARRLSEYVVREVGNTTINNGGDEAPRRLNRQSCRHKPSEPVIWFVEVWKNEEILA